MSSYGRNAVTNLQEIERLKNAFSLEDDLKRRKRY